MDIEIKIQSAGITFSSELYYIEKLLKEKGYFVEIEDEHPPLKNKYVDDLEGNGRKVKITAVHLPWGG